MCSALMPGWDGLGSAYSWCSLLNCKSRSLNACRTMNLQIFVKDVKPYGRILTDIFAFFLIIFNF